MSSPPVHENPFPQGPGATLTPDEGIPMVYHHLADATAICYQLLQVLGMPYNVSDAAQLRERQALRDSAISETCPQVMWRITPLPLEFTGPSMNAIQPTQLELLRVACYQFLQVLELPYNVSYAAQLGEHQVLRGPSISEIFPQLKFVWVAYRRLLQVHSSLLDESIRLGEHQVHRDLAISEIFPQAMEHVASWHLARQIALTKTHLAFVLVTCHQLLQIYGNEYFATRLGEYQVFPHTAPQVQPPVPGMTQPIDPQEVGAPAGAGRLHCPREDCRASFGRPQERNRHLIDVHVPRQRCPFCLYKWCRPDKIKTHLMVDHQDKLSQGVLNEIRARRGRHLVAFLNTAL